MPICEIDPWRLQYFENADCPSGTNIPTEDSDAWLWNPRHRWVYDKLAVALTQGLAAGPHGTPPPDFPVFSKPIVNLKGMGMEARIIASRSEYESQYRPGHMWMTLLHGPHVSSDVAVVEGSSRWWSHATGLPAGHGTFNYWNVHVKSVPALEARLEDWIAAHLVGYTGMANFETLGGTIIEVHLRFTDQWPDLYGEGWIEALVGLYQRGEWALIDRDRKDGYSVALFGPADRKYRHPPKELVKALLRMRGVSSIQATFHEHRDATTHAMPPGGFRLAIVNCWDLAVGLAVRERLMGHFMSHADSRAPASRHAGR